MRGFMAIAGSVFVLIAIYLLVINSDKTAQVINALAYPTIESIKTLQGR